MADERYGLKCPICNECRYFAKYFAGSIYITTDEKKHLENIFKWMYKHLIECHEQMVFYKDNDKNTVLFEMISEGNDAVVEMKEHWNKQEGDKL
jgi:hypothetical protein